MIELPFQGISTGIFLKDKNEGENKNFKSENLKQ